MFLSWRNTPAIIALGASGRTVTLDEHERWFAETLQATARLLLVIEADSRPVGMLRWDSAGDEVEISVYLLPGETGHGIGTTAFRQGLLELAAWRPTRRVVARVLADNARSLRYFEHLGFQRDERRSTPSVVTMTLQPPTRNENERRIASYFNALVAQHGFTAAGLDTSSSAALEVRYRAIGDLIDFTGLSVLEVGCGFGDLGAYLTRRFHGVEYRGIDISEAVVEGARKLHPELDVQLLPLAAVPVEPGYDVVLASGVFYILGSDADEKMREMLLQMWSRARLGIAFTALSSWSDRRTATEHFADPVRTIEWARSLSRSIVFRHDYHPGDFAMFVRKG